MLGHYQVAAQLVASPVVLGSTQLVSYVPQIIISHLLLKSVLPEFNHYSIKCKPNIHMSLAMMTSFAESDKEANWQVITSWL
jgi:hypothetical protein